MNTSTGPDNHLDNATLRSLIDDSVSDADELAAHEHLGDCERCRHRLDDFAGTDSMWDETRRLLMTATADASTDDSPASGGPQNGVSSTWIRPLLQPCPVGRLGRFADYPIDSIIGQGGMGIVLRGRDQKLGRPVAIKVLSPHLSGVGAARARFLREAKSAAAIVHPSVVPIYSIETADPFPLIVMPCVEGGNLQQRIDRDGPLPIQEVLQIGIQIAHGLAAAHERGVIHRDIKPANILVEKGTGRVLISDFGLARTLDDGSLTLSGMIAGTPSYMSPEQARGEALDERSDLFSLGSLLYALATGRPPYRGATPLAILQKLSHHKPTPVHEIDERLPSWFGRLIEILMRRDRRKRIATATEVADLLQATANHLNQPQRNTLPTRLKNRKHWRRIAWLATVLTVAVGIAFIALWIPSTASQPLNPRRPEFGPTASNLPNASHALVPASPAREVLQPASIETEFERRRDALETDINRLSDELLPSFQPSFQETYP